MEVAAPLKNDPILLGRSILSFRHLELQNLSIISDFRQSQDGTRKSEEQEEEQEGEGESTSIE